MGPDIYAVAQPEQLLALPGPPLTENQRELLSAFLRNPFLDEDTQGLAARTGLRRDELHEGLEALVEAGMLKSAGRRGFMLDLEALDPEIENADKLLPLLEPAVEEKGAEPVDIASAELLPFGMALFSSEGTQLAANAEIGRLLELPLEELDADSIHPLGFCDVVEENLRSLVSSLRMCLYCSFAHINHSCQVSRLLVCVSHIWQVSKKLLPYVCALH